MLRIEMLPGAHGDSLWIEYGTAKSRHQVLIDGGPASAYPVLKEKIQGLPKSRKKLDLLVVTHVDADHIEAPVMLLGDSSLGLKIDEVWFNAWRHITADEKDLLGPVQGEYLSALIGKTKIPWNASFEERGIYCRSTEDNSCTVHGGLKITLLSPGGEQLKKLQRYWKSEVQKAGLDPDSPEKALKKLEKDRRLRPPDVLGAAVPVPALAATPFVADNAPANGSSIALLAEFEGKSALFAGDAHATVLQSAVQELLERRGEQKLQLDAFKIAHHGSKYNLSNELLALISCGKYLVSTNGDYFNHPDPEAIARVITDGGDQPEILFNYRTEQNCCWGETSLMRRYKYRAIYPKAGQSSVALDL